MKNELIEILKELRQSALEQAELLRELRALLELIESNTQKPGGKP